jgi:hypothetical protein
VFADVEPAWLPILEMIATDIFPFGGLALDVVVMALMNQKTLTPVQQAAFDTAYSARVQTT